LTNGKRQQAVIVCTTAAATTAGASANMACVIEGIDINLVENDELLEQLVSHDLYSIIFSKPYTRVC
jgi:hypothetical protein